MEIGLRKWKLEDKEDVAYYANNQKVAENLRNSFPHPYTLADAEWFLKFCIEQDGRRQLHRAITISDRSVGSISISLGEDVYEKSAELGYWLAEEFWGNGIMSYAVRTICKEAFQMFDLERIYAEPFARNTGSRRVLEKAGFTLEGTMRNGLYKRGEFADYCMYGLLKETYC